MSLSKATSAPASIGLIITSTNIKTMRRNARSCRVWLTTTGRLRQRTVGRRGVRLRVGGRLAAWRGVVWRGCRGGMFARACACMVGARRPVAYVRFDIRTSLWRSHRSRPSKTYQSDVPPAVCTSRWNTLPFRQICSEMYQGVNFSPPLPSNIMSTSLLFKVFWSCDNYRNGVTSAYKDVYTRFQCGKAKITAPVQFCSNGAFHMSIEKLCIEFAQRCKPVTQFL